jgi:hypothetical protein
MVTVKVAFRSFTKAPDKAAIGVSPVRWCILGKRTAGLTYTFARFAAHTDVAPVLVLMCCHHIAGDFPSRHHVCLLLLAVR